MFCRKCGKEIKEGAAFCTYCGNKIVPVASESMEFKAPESSKKPELSGGKKKGGSAAIVVCVILILVLGIVAAFLGYKILSQDHRDDWETVNYDSDKEDDDERDNNRHDDQVYETEADTEKEGIASAENEVIAATETELPADITQDIEKDIEEIRAYYNAIQKNLSDFTVGKSDGITYYNGYGALVKVVAKNGQAGWNYSREYYYQNGQMCFAFVYDGLEEHRLYFKNGEMIRYIDPEKVKYEGEELASYKELAERVQKESGQLLAGYSEQAVQQYVLPNSNSEYLTMEDLEGLTKEECRIARNELFARYGRMFDDEALQAYFNACEWYQGTIAAEEFDDSVLNEYEIANRDLIVKYEEEMGYR